MSRLNEPDHYNNVEVISLSEDILEKTCLEQNSCVVTVEIKRYSLSTKYQPVSVVITGEFRYDSVVLNDDTSNNYTDVPAKIKDVDLIMKIIFVIVVILLIVAFIMYSFFVLFSCRYLRKQKKAVNNVRQQYVVSPITPNRLL